MSEADKGALISEIERDIIKPKIIAVTVAVRSQSTTENARNDETNTPKPEFTSGTGILVSKSGHILTNDHVVNGCSDIGVRSIGEQPESATLIASNERDDLA